MNPFRDAFASAAERRAAEAEAADIRAVCKTVEDAQKLIEAYWDLVERALDVVSDVPFKADNGLDSEHAYLDFDGDNALVVWAEYESDYYGGGSVNYREERFPASALLISDANLATLRANVKREEVEKAAKLHAAQEAVARDRQEAHDRAEWERLKLKFEGQK